MLSTEKSESNTCVKSWGHRDDLKHHIINFLWIPPRTEARLVAHREDAFNWHTIPIATWFHLSLLADERVVFSLCRFNFWLSNSAKFKQPIQRLPDEVESWIVVTCNNTFRTKTAQSLLNWRTRGNFREDDAHEILKEATTVFAELFSEEAFVFFQGTVTDGSLPRNAPLRWLQNTNDPGACTHPTSLSRAHRYSVSPFAVNNTQIGRAPQMPDSHNRHAQSPIRRNCVQL